MAVDLVDAALTARVDRLEHGRTTDSVELPGRFDIVAQNGKSGLWDGVLREGGSHGGLVRHDLCGSGPDPGEAEAICDRRGDWNGTVRRDGDHCVDVVAAGRLHDAIDIGEVDRLGEV
jgi:hypothetical protein